MFKLPDFGNFWYIFIIMGKNTSIALGDYFEEFVK